MLKYKLSAKGGLTFIEQLHASAMLFCPSLKVPYLSGFRHKDKKIYLMRGACKSWSCPVCGARNGRVWLARILHHMNVISDCPRWYFLTITAHKNWRGASASRKNLQQGWKKLYNRTRRKYGVSEYVKVWEFHKDGSFHLHILIGRKIGKRWLKDNSVECGMGFECDSSKAKNGGQIAGYVAKYLMKSFEHADKYFKGMRRIEASRNWHKFPDRGSDMDEWRIHQTRAGQEIERDKAKLKKYSVIDRRPNLNEEGEIILDALRASGIHFDSKTGTWYDTTIE